MDSEPESNAEPRFRVVGKSSGGPWRKIMGDLVHRTAKALAKTLTEMMPDAEIAVELDSKSDE